MKISKLFHWLYSLVMFLPVLFIPIMAIYSHRHTIDSYSVVRAEPLEVVAFQYVYNGKPTSFTDWHGDFDSNDDLYYFNGNIIYSSFNGNECDIFCDISNAELIQYHYYFVSFDLSFSCSSDGVYSDTFSVYLGDLDQYLFEDVIFTSSLTNHHFSSQVLADTSDMVSFHLYYSGSESFSNFYLYLSNLMVFDLTDIFGSGNEPSADVFKSYLIKDYYDYGNNILTVGTNNVTYNDTDIGSQFVYDTYNVVDKYFNYDKVLNIGELYDWCELNLFNGSATLGFFIFFHLLEYWLLTSLLWLIFDVLMYVPQLCHRWLDKASLE